MKHFSLLMASLVFFTVFSASAVDTTAKHFKNIVIVKIDEYNSHVCHMATAYHLNRVNSQSSYNKSTVWNIFDNKPLLCDQYNEYEQCLAQSYTEKGFSLEKGKECFNGREQYY
jgi:hypothetical protein